MTEYDFSPEAYQRHLDNMARISRWVHYTEEHRPEFEDAAALVLDRRGRPRPSSPPPPNKLKKRPHALPLPPLGTPPEHPYPYPPHVPRSVGSNFDYGMGMGVGMGMGMDYLSPGGPMYAPMSAPIPPPGGMYPQLTLVSPHHSHRSRSRSHSRRKSRSRSSSISYAAPPIVTAPPGYYPYAPQGPLPSPMGYAPPPGFMIVPPSGGSSRYHRGHSFLYI